MLAQARATELMAMLKTFVDEGPVDVPDAGLGLQRELRAVDGRERFWLDVYRGRRLEIRCTYQERFDAEPLVRLDLGSKPHTNPDGTLIRAAHIHTYREGYGVRWAAPVDPEVFTATHDLDTTLREFLNHCNVESPPATQRRFPL